MTLKCQPKGQGSTGIHSQDRGWQAPFALSFFYAKLGRHLFFYSRNFFFLCRGSVFNSSFASLFPAGAGFTLSLGHPPEHHYVMQVSFYIGWVSQFLFLPPGGYLWITWLWRPWKFAVHRSTAQRADGNTLPVFLRKRPIFSSRSFGMRAGFWFDTVLGGYRVAFMNQKPADKIFAHFPCLAPAHWYLSENSLYICLVP